MNPKNTATRTAPTAGPRPNTIGPQHAAPAALAQVVLVPEPVGELVEKIADAVYERIASREETRSIPLLVGPVEMARMLDISRATLHRLRVEGLPAVKLGDVFKYSPPDVLAYLKGRGGE